MMASYGGLEGMLMGLTKSTDGWGTHDTGVSIKRVPQNTPQNSVVLIIETPKRGTYFFGKPSYHSLERSPISFP